MHAADRPVTILNCGLGVELAVRDWAGDVGTGLGAGVGAQGKLKQGHKYELVRLELLRTCMQHDVVVC